MEVRPANWCSVGENGRLVAGIVTRFPHPTIIAFLLPKLALPDDLAKKGTHFLAPPAISMTKMFNMEAAGREASMVPALQSLKRLCPS